MDVLGCAGLGIIETLIISSWRDEATGSLTLTSQIWAAWPLVLLQYSVLKWYRIFLYPKYFSPLRHLPGPKGGHFLFGQTINLLRAPTPSSLYVDWMKEFPDAKIIRYLGVLNSEVLVCNSLESHKDVLQTECYSFRKADWWRRMVREIIGNGILAQEGAEHRAHRKMLTTPFSLANIRKIEPVFKEKARGISNVFDDAISAGDDGGKTGVIDCTETFSKATLDIMGVTILGKELSNLSTVKYRGKVGGTKTLEDEFTFHKAYDLFFAPGPVGKLLTYFNGFFPLRWLPLQENRDFLFAMKWLNSVLTKLSRERIQEVKEAMATGKYESQDSRDLTTFIVEESMPGGSAEGIQEREFVGHLLQFMAAGHDTSANLLSWSLYIMAENYGFQNKLRAEIMKLVARDPDPSYNDVDKLPYLDNFIKEALRVYSPATTIHRQAENDVVIDGNFIPKGTLFDLCPSMTMLNPLIWGDDADDVDPTRWDRLSGDSLNPYAFNAFSNGPRICIGRAFAFLEIKLILVEMIRNFRFLSVEKTFTVENPNLTLRPSGLEIRLEKIHG